MTKFEFIILWALSNGLYIILSQISLLFSIIVLGLVILGYQFYKKKYINTTLEKIKNGELKYYEFKDKLSKTKLYAIPIIYLILNILTLTKVIEFDNSEIVFLNIIMGFIPLISLFLLEYKNPSLNNGFIIGPDFYQVRISGGKIKKSSVTIKEGKNENELKIVNNKNSHENIFLFKNPNEALKELKNIA